MNNSRAVVEKIRVETAADAETTMTKMKVRNVTTGESCRLMLLRIGARRTTTETLVMLMIWKMISRLKK